MDTETVINKSKLNRALVEKWFEEYSAELQRFVSRHLGHSAESEDLVQEVFVVALRKISCYREQGHARAYLYRIAKNIIMASVRQKKKTVNLEPLIDNCCDHDPMDQEACDQAVDLKSNFHILNPAERMIVDLRIEQDLRFKEIARTLELPVNTVISKFHRAVVKLRQAFRNGGS